MEVDHRLHTETFPLPGRVPIPPVSLCARQGITPPDLTRILRFLAARATRASITNPHMPTQDEESEHADASSKRSPKFGNLDIDSESLVQELWTLEAVRLSRTASAEDLPDTLHIGLDNHGSRARPENVVLATVAAQISCALDIYILEDMCELHRCYKPGFDARRFRSSYSRLEYRAGITIDIPGRTYVPVGNRRGPHPPSSHPNRNTAAAAFDSPIIGETKGESFRTRRDFDPETNHEDEAAVSSETPARKIVTVHFEGQEQTTEETRARPMTKDMEVQHVEIYDGLLDQISETLCGIATQTIPSSQYWHVVTIACITRMSTKLKALARKLPEKARTCLTYLKNLQESSQDDDSKWEIPDLLRNDDQAPQAVEYCWMSSIMLYWLADAMRVALMSLGASKQVEDPGIGALDLSCLLYKAGVTAGSIYLHGDMTGGITGTTGSLQAAYASHGLLTTLDLYKAMQRSRLESGPTVSGASGHLHATLKVMFEMPTDNIGDNGRPFCLPQARTMDLCTAGDAATFIILHSCMHPSVINGFETSVNAIASFEAFGDSRHQLGDITFSFALKTESKQTSSTEHPRPGSHISTNKDTSSIDWKCQALSESILFRERLGLLIFPAAGRKWQALIEIAKSWEVGECSITVSCFWYVLPTAMVAAVLVAGGLVAGLTVGERVEGVDPFNFTMFAWILAGFIILIAKGIWVSDWPWRDFLHARVTCRSARELRRVTHLSDRELLVLLLWLEQQTLTVSGPYNGPFTNCATGEGFSIDIPSDLKALLASGLVPVQVGTLSGPKIVFMSFRKDGRLRAVSPRGSFSGMILCSKDITGIADATRPTSQPQLHEANKHMMEKQQTGHTSGAGPEKVQEAVVEKLDGIKWLSVYGIYEPEEQLFR